eukprot:1160938-Pelagomonas_calceolata.AAC.19
MGPLAAGEGSERAKDGLGRSLLHYASAKGHLELVQQLSSTLRVDEADAHAKTTIKRGGAVCVPVIIAHVTLPAVRKGAPGICSCCAGPRYSSFRPVTYGKSATAAKQGWLCRAAHGHASRTPAPVPGHWSKYLRTSAALESLEKITTERLLKDARMVVNEVVKDNISTQQEQPAFANQTSMVLYPSSCQD